MTTYAEPKTRTARTPITISERDKNRLEKMIAEIRRTGRKEESLDALTAELNRAKIANSGTISQNVVTMDSMVAIVDLDTLERSQYRIIFPDQARGEDDEISVLSPIGTGILGYKTGDIVEWEVPAGIRRFRIVRVDSQPNAVKTYHS